MPLYGKIVVIKRDGSDGTHFPVTANSCLFGRKRECDIRIQLPQVSKEHCKIEINENKEVILFNLSSVTPTQVNGNNITDPTYLKHGDVLTIIDRSFRFEYPPISLPQRRRSRSQEKDTLQVLHVQQDLCSQDSNDKSPQIPDKELEHRNQTPNGNKERTQELVTAQNDASESVYKLHPSERKNEISVSTEFSVSVKYEDAAKNTEGNSELFSQDTSPRKGGNIPEGISQIADKRSAANLTSADVMQKDVSHAGNATKNQDVSSVVPKLEVNSSRKSSMRRSSATRQSAGLQSYDTKQEEGSEDTNSLKFQHIKDSEPEKSPKTQSTIFRASRSSTKIVPEPCCIVSLDYTDETRHTQKSDQTLRASTLEAKPNLIGSGSDGSILSAPTSNQKYSLVYSTPFTGNSRKCFSNILPVELDSLNEINCAGTSFEIEECSLTTADNEINDVTGNKYSKIRRRSKTMDTERQTLKEQKNEMSVNSGAIASSLYSNNSRSPRRSFKQNNSSMNRNTVMKMSTEELVGITPASEVDRITPGQLSDENFGRNCPEEHAERIKEPISDAHEQTVEVKNNMPVMTNLDKSNVQTPVQAVSEINMSSPCRPNTQPEMKKSPRKRKNTELDIFQPLGKRKRVSFGGQLSPELFDKRLPPNSPLKKGAIPARLSLPFGNSPRAVLKKAAGLRQSIIKGLSGREQGKNILFEKAASPSVRKSPSVTSTSTCRSLATSPSAFKSPTATAASQRRSPGAASSASPRRSPGASASAAASPRRSQGTVAASPRRSPGASAATSASPRRSPGTAAALPRRSPGASASPRRSPGASASPRRSPGAAASPRRSPGAAASPRRSPGTAASPRRSPGASASPRRSPASPATSASPRGPAVTAASALPPKSSDIASSPNSPAAALSHTSPDLSPSVVRPPAALPPRSRAVSPSDCFACNTPQRKGRFSISSVSCPSPSEEMSVAVQMDVSKEITELKTWAPTEQASKASGSVRRTKNFASKRNSLHRRSGAASAIQSKRRSGASEANLIVAKSWADVVKQGIPKSQLKTTATKCGLKKSSSKKPTKPSKNNVSILKTPVRKFTGHLTTGHANSPAPIVVGKAHISSMNLAAQVPKVMYNYPLKQHSDLNESFTGLAEMFTTPPSRKQEESLSSSEKKMPTQEAVLEIHAEAEAEEGHTPSCNGLNQQQHSKEDTIPSFNQNKSQVSILDQDDLLLTPRGECAFRETVKKDGIVITVNHTDVTGLQGEIGEPRSETIMVLSGTKRLLRTPKQKPEPVEALSGVKRLLRTPKQKPEPMEALSGVKRLLRTPKQKPEPVEALSGVKRLLRTPEQNLEQVADDIVSSNLNNAPEEISEELRGNKRKEEQRTQNDTDYDAEPEKRVGPMENLVTGLQGENGEPRSETIMVLSATKRLLRTPKEKPEPVEALSGVKRLLRTPKQKPETVEALSGVKRLLRTPKQKPEPVEALSGIKRLLKTPKQKPEPVEALSGVKRLLRTPKQKPEPVEALSGVKRLLKTPKQNLEQVAGDIVSCNLINTPEEMSEELRGNKRKEEQRMQNDMSYNAEPEKRVSPMENLEGIQRLFKTPKEKNKPLEDLDGISLLVKTPKQTLPVDDYLGLQKYMAEPNQNCLSPELDYSGTKELLEIRDEHKVELPEFVSLTEEENGSHINSRKGNYSMGIESEIKEAKLEASTFSVQKSDKHDIKLEDTIRHVISNSFNELKTDAGRETIETKCETSKVEQTQSYHPEEIISQNGAKSDFVKELIADLDSKDKEEVEVLVLGRRTRKGKANEYSSMKEHTKQVQRYTRNSCRAKSAKVEDSMYQNANLSLVQESESSMSAVETAKRSSKETCRKFTETVESVMSAGISHTPKVLEPTKGTSVKIQPYHKRRMAAKEKETEATCDLKENANIPEKGCLLESKITLKSKEDVKNELKPEFVEENIQDKMQNKDLENAGIENIGNSLKRSRRGKKTPRQTKPETLNAATEEDKTGRKKCLVSKSYKKTLEKSTEEIKDSAVKQEKGRKVHFQLEKNDTFPLQEKSTLGDEGSSPQKEKIALLESTTPEHASRRSKRRPCIPPKEKQALEIGDAKYKQEKNLSSEKVLPKGDKSGVSCSLVQEEAGQEGQNGECPDETLKVQLESIQAAPEQSRPSRHKVVKENNVPRRGRNKQAICKEIPTENDSEQAAEMKKGDIKEKQPRKGKGRKIVPQLEIPFPVEHSNREGEDQKTDNLDSALGECSERQIQNDADPNENQKMILESAPVTAQQKEKENPLRKSRRKVLSHEIITENVSKKEGDLVDQNMDIVSESLPKRTRGGRAVSKFQIPAKELEMGNLSSAQEEGSLQQPQHAVKTNEIQKVPMESVPVPAKHSPPEGLNVTEDDPPRRGRRNAIQKSTTEHTGKQAGGTSMNKNLPKCTKGRRIGSKFQIPTKEDLEMGNLSSVPEEDSLQQPQHAAKPNETEKVPLESVQVPAKHSPPEGLNIIEDNLPKRGRRKAIVQKAPAEPRSKQAGGTKEQGVVDENACSAKKPQSKQGKARKTVPVSQALSSPLQKSSPLQPSTQITSAVEQQSEASETKTNGNLSHRGRRRKTDEIIPAGSLSASKKPRLLDKSDKEKMPRDIQDVPKENISKRRGRKQLVLHKTLAECNGQLGNESEKAAPVKEESIPLEKGSGKDSKSKKKGKQMALASEVSSSLNVSITQPPLSLETGRTPSENQSTVTENGAVGKARLANRGSRNKTAAPAAAVRRKCKESQEEVDHENSSEKTTVTNQKPCRSDRKKLVALEATICASLKEKYGLNASSDTSSKDPLEILDNSAAKKNPPRRGRRRQVNSDSETSAATSDARDVLKNNLKSKAENSESTTSKTGKRKKMKEEPTRAAAETAEELESGIRRSKRTKK